MLTSSSTTPPSDRQPLRRAPRPQGRHAAPRRRPVVPLVLTGVLVASGATLAVPGAAHAFAGPTHRASLASSRLPAPVTPYRVLPGQHLEVKAPTWVLPVVRYQLTGRFGQVSGLWAHFHTGLDFAAPSGTEIHSIAPGVVLSTGYDGAYGNKTTIRLEDGTVLWYCHQTSYVVHPGERVATGQLIGYVGSTGNTTGPHLHLEVHPHGGAPIDPEKWLPEHDLHP